jgi:hypothetical protein
MENKMNEERKKIAEQAFGLFNSTIAKHESLATYISVYFRDLDKDHSGILESIMLENIIFIKNNLSEIEKILNEKYQN